jgi:hypothetical protein
LPLCFVRSAFRFANPGRLRRRQQLDQPGISHVLQELIAEFFNGLIGFGTFRLVNPGGLATSGARQERVSSPRRLGRGVGGGCLGHGRCSYDATGDYGMRMKAVSCGGAFRSIDRITVPICSMMRTQAGASPILSPRGRKRSERTSLLIEQSHRSRRDPSACLFRFSSRTT